MRLYVYAMRTAAVLYSIFCWTLIIRSLSVAVLLNILTWGTLAAFVVCLVRLVRDAVDRFIPQ